MELSSDLKTVRVGDKVSFSWLGTNGEGIVKRVNKADVMVMPTNVPKLQVPIRVWNFKKI